MIRPGGMAGTQKLVLKASFKSLRAPFPQSPFEEGDPPYPEWTRCPNGKALAETIALLKTGQFILI